MQLKKSSENVNRSFDNEGNVSENIDRIQYQILDDNDNVVGNANIGTGYANANFNLSGFSSIDEGERKLSELFGITSE